MYLKLQKGYQKNFPSCALVILSKFHFFCILNSSVYVYLYACKNFFYYKSNFEKKYLHKQKTENYWEANQKLLKKSYLQINNKRPLKGKKKITKKQRKIKQKTCSDIIEIIKLLFV